MTVGYGDIAPKTRVGRVITATMILTTFVLVPIQVNKLVAVISTHSGYTESYKEYDTHPHAIVTITGGDINAGALNDFFYHFFHPDSPNWNEKVGRIQCFT